MYAIIKKNQIIGFTDEEITEENMLFDELIEGDFDTNRPYFYENGEVKENFIVVDLKGKDISEYKAFEQKTIQKRDEYLTAELLPDGVFKTQKLAKLDTERATITAEHTALLESLQDKYGEDIINELI